MDTGRLNKRVEFGIITNDTDDYGQPIETFTTLFHAWANVKTISGRESILAGAVVSKTTITIVCRYNGSLTTRDKVKYNGEKWNITNVAPDERNRFMNVTAEIMQ